MVIALGAQLVHFFKTIAQPGALLQRRGAISTVQLVLTTLKQKDDVRCWMSANFGHRRWPLPSQELSFPIGPDRYRYFARAILEGKVRVRTVLGLTNYEKVFQSLEQFVPHLKNKPNIMNKPWTKAS